MGLSCLLLRNNNAEQVQAQYNNTQICRNMLQSGSTWGISAKKQASSNIEKIPNISCKNARNTVASLLQFPEDAVSEEVALFLAHHKEET
jgi:hypothetical protein